MRIETARTIHLGVNFVMAPAPDLGRGRYLEFQRRLAEERIEFTQSNVQPPQVILARPGPVQLQVQLGGVQNQPVGQLLAVASVDPSSSAVDAGVQREIFIEDVETIVEVFQEVWPERRQIVSRDAALRKLFDAGEQHAFQFLWERRFGQAEESLAAFGRPVLGGGLRLVMPSPPEQAEQPDLVEVKVESFLRDPTKIFTEVIIQWPRPEAEAGIDAKPLVVALDDFMDKLIPFIRSNSTGSWS